MAVVSQSFKKLCCANVTYNKTRVRDCASTLRRICDKYTHHPKTYSVVRQEVNHVEPHMAVVPGVQEAFLGAVGEHGQHAPWRPQVKGHVDRLSLQQVKGKADPGVLGVGDVEDAAGDEGVAGLGAGVGGVDVGCDGEGLLVKLSHHDALVHAGREDQPHAVLVRRHFEIGLGVGQQVGEAVVHGIVDGQGVQPLCQQVESVEIM